MDSPFLLIAMKNYYRLVSVFFFFLHISVICIFKNFYAISERIYVPEILL